MLIQFHLVLFIAICFARLVVYDERLTRNQDNELNYRIRKNGGKIYLAKDIEFDYYSRDTVRGITKMAVENGKWNIITTKMCPGTMGLRHFIPLLFVLSIISLTALGLIHSFFWWLLLFELTLYFSLGFYFSIQQSRNLVQIFQILLLFPAFHISYGIGSVVGIFHAFKSEYNKEYTPPIL